MFVHLTKRTKFLIRVCSCSCTTTAILSLPLCGSDHGTLLHVKVQLLTAKTGFTEF
uniref:Uncharacterized protein n=1 Tax=Helianthus annuus TaxID=4232 RepID=A0A251TLI0_HELAN